MPALEFDVKSSALILIDLQKAIVGMPLAPRAGSAVVGTARRLLDRFRELHLTVVLVHVDFAVDGADALKQAIDAPPWRANRPPDWAEFVPELNRQASDVVITKRNWGAFYGTDLDLQLRRRGVRTIVLGGIATNFGVESTARDAFERNYELILAEDAMSSMAAEAHTFAVQTIFPRLGRVRSKDQILEAMAG